MQRLFHTNELIIRAFCALLGFTMALLLVNYRPIDRTILENQMLDQLQRKHEQKRPQAESVELQQLREKVLELQSTLAATSAPLEVRASSNASGSSIEDRIDAINKLSLGLSIEVLKTRIFCMVLLRPNGEAHKRAVLQSWGMRCSKLLFLLGGKELQVEEIPNAPWAQIVHLPVEDGWDNTWLKVRQGVKYVHRVYRGQFDWFMRIDDDGYVIMENLALFLRKRDPTKPEMYGVHYKTYGSYIGTGAGLTLSSYNFDSLAKSLDNQGCSTAATHNDDVEIANCLKTVGITVTDSRDEHGRFRYFPLDPQGTLNKKHRPDWLYAWLQYEMADGQDCCADDYIGFHYVGPEMMRAVEFLTYVAHPFSRRTTWQRNWINFTQPSTTTLAPTPAPGG